MKWLKTWCSQCGPDVPVDEDGCCTGCGCDAVGEGADAAHRARANAIRDAIRAVQTERTHWTRAGQWYDGGRAALRAVVARLRRLRRPAP